MDITTDFIFMDGIVDRDNPTVFFAEYRGSLNSYA